MRKLTLRLSEDEYANLVEFQQILGVKTISNAVKNAVKNALNAVKNAVKLDPSRTRVATLPIENIKTIYEDPDGLRSDSTFVDNKKIKKNTPPPEHLPADWSPSRHLRDEFCQKYGLHYSRALEMFCDIVADENRRSANWDATWTLKVKKGSLKQIIPEESEIQPEDTMAHQLGNAGTLDYLTRG